MNEVVIDGIVFNFQLNLIKCSPNHPLDLTTRSPSAAYLLALLIGGINISDEKFSANQCKNYMIIGAPSASAFVSQNLERSFSDLREDIKGKSFFLPGKKLILEYLSSQRSNHALFSPLLNELARAIINNNNGRGLSAFVHIYRALESSSYSFPLFYCRYEREYLIS